VDDQAKFASIMLVKPTDIIWGPMTRRDILFWVSVLGDVANSMSNKIVFYLKHDPTYKVVICLITKLLAEGHLLILVKKTLVPI
jgi:hypothetical protein